MSFSDLADQLLTSCMDTFGESVQYTRAAGGGPVTITAVFNRSSVVARPGVDGAEVQSYAPTLRIRLADLAAAPAEGDQVEVQGGTYSVLSLDEDGNGEGILILGKVG